MAQIQFSVDDKTGKVRVTLPPDRYKLLCEAGKLIDLLGAVAPPPIDRMARRASTPLAQMLDSVQEESCDEAPQTK
jgi:hypothetical protein